MKTFRINLANGAFDLIDADEYKLSGGVLCLYRQRPGSRRVQDKVLLAAYGPLHWTTFTPDETMTTEGERVPMDLLNETHDTLARVMRFLTPFGNVNRGLLHDDVQGDARRLKLALSDLSKKLAPFCDDQDEDEDDD